MADRLRYVIINDSIESYTIKCIIITSYNNVPRLVEKDSVIYLHKEFKDVFINKISKSSSNPIFTPFRLQ